MTFTEVKKRIKQHLGGFLGEFGFSLVAGSQGSGYTIEQASEGLKLRIGTDKLSRSDGYELPFGIEQVQFSEVERVVHPLILQHKLYDTATPPAELGMTFGSSRSTVNVTSADRKVQSIHIDSEGDVISYCEAVKELLLHCSFPWFEKYSRLEAVNEFINNVGMQDILNSFAGPFPTQFYRAMVIAEKCGNRTRTLEIREECLFRFNRRKSEGASSPEKLNAYQTSLAELCTLLKLPD